MALCQGTRGEWRDQPRALTGREEPQMGPRAGEGALPHCGRPDTSCLFKAIVTGVWGDEARMFWSLGSFIILHCIF